MSRTFIAAFAAALVATGTGPASAVNDNTGTAGFSFLKIGVGARPAALGGAYAAVACDLEATGWNPAGLFGIRERSAILSYSSYLVDTEAGFLSIAFPGPDRIWSFSVNYFSHGELRRTDAEGQDLGTFGAFDVAAYVTAAQQVWNRRLTLGVNLKAIYSSIDDFTSDAYAVDLGAIGPGPVKGMKLGASLANLGAVRSGFTDGFEDSLPVLFRVGFTHRPAHAPLPMMFVADFNVPNDGDAYATFGAEVRLAEGFFLRPGYSLQQTGLEGDENLGLSAGAGLELDRYRVDYAFTSFPSLGDVHRLSLSGKI